MHQFAAAGVVYPGAQRDVRYDVPFLRGESAPLGPPSSAVGVKPPIVRVLLGVSPVWAPPPGIPRDGGTHVQEEEGDEHRQNHILFPDPHGH
jgi:hypothetical protein